MESLGYLLLYFLRGRLPWQGLKAETTQKHLLVMEMKENISADKIFDQAPREFADYMDHVRALQFEDKPNYSFLRNIFKKLFVRQGYEYDNVFDWTVKKYLELEPQQEEIPT